MVTVLSHIREKQIEPGLNLENQIDDYVYIFASVQLQGFSHVWPCQLLRSPETMTSGYLLWQPHRDTLVHLGTMPVIDPPPSASSNRNSPTSETGWSIPPRN